MDHVMALSRHMITHIYCAVFVEDGHSPKVPLAVVRFFLVVLVL